MKKNEKLLKIAPESFTSESTANTRQYRRQQLQH